MANKSKKLSFEDWVKHIFDHPVRERAWYFNPNAEKYEERLKPRQAIEYMQRLFQSASQTTNDYSDEQVDQGLYYLISPSASAYAFFFFDHKVPLELRIEAFTAIYSVFEQIFAVRCSLHLSHKFTKKVDIVRVNALNRVCYMWWDVFPLYGNSGDPNRMVLEQPCLQLMERVLKLNSLACRESALHGLGHWHHSHRSQVEGIIDRFLESNSAIHPDLRSYALEARQGSVL